LTRFAISFYGWPKVDLFFAAWERAGFRIAGHIISRKRYASKSSFLQCRHEAAYLLVKGNPAFPASPLPGVMDWTYSGNTHHPTQKSIHILKPLIETFTRRGELILDPIAGSGSSMSGSNQMSFAASRFSRLRTCIQDSSCSRKLSVVMKHEDIGGARNLRPQETDSRLGADR